MVLFGAIGTCPLRMAYISLLVFLRVVYGSVLYIRGQNSGREISLGTIGEVKERSYFLGVLHIFFLFGRFLVLIF